MYDPARTISIHALLAESDVPHPRQRRGCAVISIHALLAESDGGASSRTPRPCTFLSTLSLRRATQRRPVYRRAVLISIHALLAESDPWRSCAYQRGNISIHALLAESDPLTHVRLPPSNDFYPRSPCGERRWQTRTLPHCWHFYPRSPCGERRPPWAGPVRNLPFLSTLSLRRATTSLVVIGTNCIISIHALLAESDAWALRTFTKRSTISIHALLAESDACWTGMQSGTLHFYPRSPCGERPPKLSRVVPTPIFLSTLSLRRATGQPSSVYSLIIISIHALLAESDIKIVEIGVGCLVFLSTLSLRRATMRRTYPVRVNGISIHALLAESDTVKDPTARSNAQFLSTLSLRRATYARSFVIDWAKNFYPRSPCGERPPCATLSNGKAYFYPRSPCGERLMDTLILANAMLFLSTLSLRRATASPKP